MNRLNWSEVAPAGAKALYGVHHYVTNSTALPEELIHLVTIAIAAMNAFNRLGAPFRLPVAAKP